MGLTADYFKQRSSGKGLSADFFKNYAELKKKKDEEEAAKAAFNNSFIPQTVTTPSATAGGLPEATTKYPVAPVLDMFKNQVNKSANAAPVDNALTNLLSGKPAWAAKENEPLVPKAVNFSTPEAQAKTSVVSAMLASQAKQAAEAQKAAQASEYSNMSTVELEGEIKNLDAEIVRQQQLQIAYQPKHFLFPQSKENAQLETDAKAKETELKAKRDKLNAEMSTRKQAENSQRLYAAAQAYTSYMQASDYAQLSVASGSKLNGNSIRADGDKVYDYINDINGYRKKASEASAMTSTLPAFQYNKYDYMSDDEIGIYNYLYAKEGKASAKKYLDSISESLNTRQQEQETSDTYWFSQEHPVIASLASVGANLEGGAISAIDLLAQNIKKAFTGESVDYNSEAQEGLKYAQTLRSGASSNLNSKGSFVYNTAMSGIDSLAAWAATGGSALGAGLILSTSAGTSAAKDIAARGGSDAMALLGGIAAGAFEAFFERFSLAQLNALKEMPVTGLKNVFLNAVKSVVTNAEEEAATELANILFDTLAMGDVSNWENSIQQYMAQGMSESEAKQKTALDFGKQVLLAGASGGLMGLGFGGLASISGLKKGKAEAGATALDNLKNGIATAADIQRIAKNEELYNASNVNPNATADQRVAALTKANEAVKAERLAAGEDLTKTSADVAVETAEQLDIENRLSNVLRLFKGERLTEAEISDVVSDRRSREVIQGFVQEDKSLADLIGLQFFAEKEKLDAPQKMLLVGNIEALSKKIQQNNAVANLAKSVNAPHLAQERTGQALTPVGNNNAAKTENAPTGIVERNSAQPTAREMYGAVEVADQRMRGRLGMEDVFYSPESETTPTKTIATRIPTMEELIARYGAIDKKAPTSRQISKRAGLDEHRVAKFEQTVAKNVDDVNAAQLQQSVAEGAAGFQETTNKSTIEDANLTYASLGYEKVVERLKSLFNSDRRVSHKDAALAMRAIREAAQRGDKETFIDLTASLASISSEMGQAIQALSIFSRLDASGQLMAVQKLVDRWNAKHPSKKKLTDAERQEVAEIRKEITATKAEQQKAKEQTQRDVMQKKIDNLERQIKKVNGEYVIPQELVDKFLSVEAGDETALQEIMAAVWQNVGENTQASIWDKLNAWRMLCMLANPTTHLRNIAGNAAFAPARLLRDVIRTGMEKKLSPEERRAAILTPKDKANKELAKEYFKKDVQTLQAGGKYNPMSEAYKSQTIFKTMPLEWTRKANYNALEAEDSWFMRIAYVQAFAQTMKAQGWTADTITETQLAQARAYAGEQALEATYRQESAIADALSRWANKNVPLEIIINGLVPFKKTPVNIAKTGIKYSPFGLAGGLVTWAKDVKKTGHISAKAIDRIASGLSGTAVLGLGIALGALGAAVGKGDDDDAKKRAFDRQNGITEWSLKFGDTYITLDWLAPMCMPFFMGVQIWEAFDEDYNVADPSVLKSIVNIIGTAFNIVADAADPMSSMSIISGLNSAIKSASYDAISDDSAFVNFGVSLLGNSATNFTKQFLPTLGSKIADTIDPTARRTTATTALSDVEKLGKSLMYKIPGIRNFLQPSIDTWGRTDTQKGFGAGVVRGVDNMLNPGDVNTIRLSDVDKALYALYENTKDSAVFPATAKKSFTENGVKYEMNDTQYTHFATVKGQRSLDLVTGLLNHPYWNSLTDAQKIEAIKAAYTYATELAKAAVFADIPQPRIKNPNIFIRNALN